MSDNQSGERPDPNARAEEYRQVRQELDRHQPDSREYQQVRSAADRVYTRFVGDLHKVTQCQKPASSYSLSSQQIVQARTESESALNIKVHQAVLKGSVEQDISHYFTKVRSFEMITACRKEAKGTKRQSKLDPTKSEIYFPELPGDVSINPHDADAPTIIDCLSANRAENGSDINLVLLDLELMCVGMTMRSRPDISLFDCLQLTIDGYSVMDIARHFAPNSLTKQQFGNFYSALIKWLQGKKVQAILGDYLGKTVIIYLILMAEFIDF